ncbi:SDR family NAD(P)-dependent oxidoreductase [Nocardioides endophyticus]|uniref:SDR family NAD(P)-dependent oxidoreductase n=1 Tax=Nocardioides endophyticus TaxID=1353775 RepID=A0ABP8YVH1_9ACTN
MLDAPPQRLLVVGGGSGIGFAAARLATGRGARVLVADLDPETPKRYADEGCDVDFVVCDATSARSVAATVDAAVDALGTLDGVFTTVGGAHLADVADLTDDVWDRELSFNLTSAWLVAREALRVLRAQGAGSLVLTSSGQAIMGAVDRAGYAAAKAGVTSLTRSLAAAAAPDRVRVNCIAPGPTDTPRFRAMNGGDEGVARVRAAMPLGEIPTSEDCADLALYLLSPGARAITGQTIHVNGGLLMP